MDKETAAQGRFEGWAVVELMGHQREVGFVTTENFGAASLFRVDTPGLPEREYVLQRPEFACGEDGRERFVPAGAKVLRKAVPAKSRLVGVPAIYAINPCTEETALRVIDEIRKPPLILLALPAEEARALPSVSEEDGYDDDEAQAMNDLRL